MKICFLREYLKQGGAERAIASLANAFSEMGHEVFLYLTSEYTPYFDLHPSVVIREIHAEGKIRAARPIRLIRAVGRRLAADRPDCVIAFDPYMTLTAMLAGKRYGIRVISSERSNPKIYPASKKWRGIRWLCVPKIDGWVFQTRAAYEYYQKRIKKKFKIIPNAIFNRNILALAYPEKRESIVCGMGRFHPAKGFQDIIAVFARLPEEFSDYALRLYGGSGDYKQALQGQIDGAGLTSRAFLIEGDENAACAIASASAFVFPSYFEGMPNALMEAMAAGLPCISYDCEMGPADLIRDGENGILVPVGDQEGLFQALLSILTDRERAERMGKAAFLLRENYSLERISQSWIDFIQDVCGKGKENPSDKKNER